VTHDRGSSSREPLDLAILDEELGEVLLVSYHVPTSLSIDTSSSPGSRGTRRNRESRKGKRGHTQSISCTGGVEFSFKYFQIGWVSDPFTSPCTSQHDSNKFTPRAYLLCNWESNSVIELTELKYFIICSWFLCFELYISGSERSMTKGMVLK
jgi:hypothetical protein